MNKTVGIILAGGIGQRAKSYIPKYFMSLNGKIVIQYVIDEFNKSGLFSEIIVVCTPGYEHLLKNYKTVRGGATRNESINNALKACPKNTKYVLFHDAARPFIKAADLPQFIESLKKYDAAITAETITDALYHANREDFKLIQTPEAFHFKYLKERFNKNAPSTAIYEHVFPCRVKFIDLGHQNLKITYPRDIYIAEQLMKYQDVIHRDSNVKNKSILIFGGTGGIGSALTKQLKEQGAKVISLGSDDVNLSKPYTTFTSDYTNFDCIIYSAGAYTTDSEGLLSNYDTIMNVNFKSVVNIIENASQMLKPNGSIILLGSTAAAFGRSGIALYSASKAALNCFVEAIAPVLAKKGFRINVICPAKVATPLQTHINPNANQKDMIQPDALAKIIAGYIDIESTGNIVYVIDNRWVAIVLVAGSAFMSAIAA